MRPDYTNLKSIFRQITPNYLVATGTNIFFEDLVKLLDPTHDFSDFQKFKVTKKQPANANSSNVSFYPFNRKNQDELRKRIYELDLPGILTQSSKAEKQLFIDSMLPMTQELVVISLGNLLKYLTDNHLKWRHAFLTLDKNPIITNITSCILEAQVQIDEYSFNSLNIFSYISHPSGFKMQIRKDGLSLFNLLNHCSSTVGVQELKTILRQPTRDILELNLRLSTVQWCINDENLDHVDRFKALLSGLININLVFRRIIVNHGKCFNDWKSFKKTVYNINCISEMCASFSDDSIRATFLADLGEFYKEGESINGILFALEKIVDLEEIEEKKRFIVKTNLDPQLDEKKEALKAFVESFNGMQPDEPLKKINDTENAFQFAYFPEMGFVIGTRLNLNQLNLESIELNGIELLLSTVDSRIFRTPNCRILNEEYEKRMSEIIANELTIFNKLIKYINENYAELVDAAKLCAKFDCLIAFSIVSKKFNYVKPNITTDRQISIIKGRHPLIEQIKKYIPSTTLINEDNKNFINIIRAPNSTGKSVYIKQIALICYMTFIGCFVPAESCTISLLHSIYTRIYTPESVYQNESAFMSDLQQMSKVIMNSTNKSLLLIDEFAKGTFYKDGIALLTAVIEHFAERENLIPFVFITTHYAQIFKILSPNPYVRYKTIAIKYNNTNVFQSTYELEDKVDDKQWNSNYPESKMIMTNIFHQEERDEELETFNRSVVIAIDGFVMLMAKQMLRKNQVTYNFIKDIYTKIDIEEFLNK